MRPRTIVFVTIAAAAVVFLVVQDRITAEGARRYVALQRAAPPGQPSVTIDQVMAPAIQRSVQHGLMWGGVVLAAGLGAAGIVSRHATGGES